VDKYNCVWRNADRPASWRISTKSYQWQWKYDAFSRRMSQADRVDYLMAACVQSLFDTCTLRQHVYKRAPASVSCHSHHAGWQSHNASPTWCGFANAEDKNRLEAFLSRSVRLDYRVASSATLKSIRDVADNMLFNQVSRNSRHLLHVLLPPTRDTHCELRVRKHNFTLPIRSSTLTDCNFINSMLYNDLNFSSYIVSCDQSGTNKIYYIETACISLLFNVYA